VDNEGEMMTAQDVVEFVRKKDYLLIKELGQGACGRTVLLRDEAIEEEFVCKKYSPLISAMKEELFKNFVQEIKLLFLLNHPNIVRVFNYYLYPERHTGYILMEHVEGLEIDDYLAMRPEELDKVFLQTIEGFSYLEQRQILHRDIRTQNLMVSSDGNVKIIDFGFGKRIGSEVDFDKSISLNWWCELPQEFSQGLYDFGTEVYFVGQMFAKIIQDKQITDFSHANVLERMVLRDPRNRTSSFSTVQHELSQQEFLQVQFSEAETDAYRSFSSQLVAALTKLESSTKYISDAREVLAKLEDAFKNSMLNEYLTKPGIAANCFLSGTYYYRQNRTIEVEALGKFLHVFRAATTAKRNILLRNLHTRLDAIDRYEAASFDDDIPF
jgi:serine/threonine protein kinase